MLSNTISFLQSHEWSDFQSKIGRKIFSINKKSVMKYNLPLGMNYLYCPRPDFKNKEEFVEFIHETTKIGKKEKSMFLKIEPDFSEDFPLNADSRIAKNFQISKTIQPQNSLLLDLKINEEEILANMHPKTRYNIRLAQKHKVKIEQTIDPKKIDIFWQLAIKTGTRDGFRYHEKEYYKKMLEILGKKEMVKLFIAYKNNAPAAAILVVFYKNTAIYLHGASDHNFRQLMAPYLLQWEAIKEAKKRKCLFYDFWGIKLSQNLNIKTLEPDINHPWYGITKFKLGFAPKGQFIHYPDALDLIFQPFWYRVYGLLKRSKN